MSIIKDKLEDNKTINMIAEESGLTKKEVKRRLEFCSKNGISAKDYLRFGYWHIPEDLLLDAVNNGERRKRIAKQIAKAHGKNKVDIEKQMIEAKYELGLRIGYFKKYNWDMLTDEEKDGMFLRPYGRQMSQKYRVKNAKSWILNNKDSFYKEFPEAICRKWFRLDDSTDLETFKSKVSEFDADYGIYKPKKLSGGKGIVKFPVREGLEETFKKISSEPGVIEECVVQHEVMNSLCPDSVNTIRVVCLYWNDEFKIFYAVCRMAAGDGTQVDNVSQGGLAAGVDIKTGTINTYAADKHGEAVHNHPATGTQIMGFTIPYWDEVLALVEKCSKKAFDVCGVGYVGWDVAITPTGPIIIEGNNWPSPSLIQLCNYITYGKGMKYLIEDYL